jgi:D-sedoheptulose 7-phosphate isomerase
MKIDDSWIRKYFSEYMNLGFSEQTYQLLYDFVDVAQEIKKDGKKLMFAGNGASAAISAHGSVDFTKQGGVRAINFNEADLITCFANDYGYDNWISNAVRLYGDEGDALVLISVSGTSPSVVEAAKFAKENGIKVISFTGRDKQNSLKQLGDINFWVDSNAYNIVECIHMIWITTVIDMVIGKSVYETS